MMGDAARPSTPSLPSITELCELQFRAGEIDGHGRLRVARLDPFERDVIALCARRIDRGRRRLWREATTFRLLAAKRRAPDLDAVGFVVSLCAQACGEEATN